MGYSYILLISRVVECRYYVCRYYDGRFRRNLVCEEMLKEVLSIINEAHQTTHEILSGSSAHTLAPPLITEHQQEVGMM